MKRLISIIIIITVLASSMAFAEEPAKLTLDQALLKAVSGSKQLQMDDQNVSLTKDLYNEAVADANGMDISYYESLEWDEASPDWAGLTEKRKTKELTPEEKDYDYQMAKKTRELAEIALKEDVYDTFYTLAKANIDIEIKTQSAKIAALKLEQAALKFEKGVISKNDYTLVELNKKDVDLQVNLANRNKKRYANKLYILMNEGYHPDVKELDVKLDYVGPGIDEDTAVQTALTNRLEIYSAKESEDLKQIAFDIVDQYYDETDISYTQAQNDLDEAIFNIDIAKMDVEFEIRTEYNDLLNLLDTIEVNKREVERNNMHYSVAKVKLILGMITDLDLQETELNLNKAKAVLDSSKMDYIVAKFKFDNAQGIGPVITE
jgi:hypothetical protein